MFVDDPDQALTVSGLVIDIVQFVTVLMVAGDPDFPEKFHFVSRVRLMVDHLPDVVFLSGPGLCHIFSFAIFP